MPPEVLPGSSRCAIHLRDVCSETPVAIDRCFVGHVLPEINAWLQVVSAIAMKSSQDDRFAFLHTAEGRRARTRAYTKDSHPELLRFEVSPSA
jgi:hypothetical protein